MLRPWQSSFFWGTGRDFHVSHFLGIGGCWICSVDFGLTELFGGFYWYWVVSRVFLWELPIIIMDTTARNLVHPISLS